MTPTSVVLLFCLSALALGGCGGKLPDTRYYDLAPPDGAAKPGDATLVLEPLTTESAYDDERIVYRQTPYRLDYYQYHRWSSVPGTLIGNYLETALEHTGQFGAVVRNATSDATVSLSGRVVAIEEIDDSKTKWHGHLVLELTLTDVISGKTLWTKQFEENVPLDRQSPEGLARAMTVAMNRIVHEASPQIAEIAAKQKTVVATQR
ncbi:MAG TPA: ABC-type transport auxiliary lipoprotein family protein [Kofleriaceae bacterium]|jgi:ABC-type uncharacterized transport system auxiliary subunit